MQLQPSDGGSNYMMPFGSMKPRNVFLPEAGSTYANAAFQPECDTNDARSMSGGCALSSHELSTALDWDVGISLHPTPKHKTRLIYNLPKDKGKPDLGPRRLVQYSSNCNCSKRHLLCLPFIIIVIIIAGLSIGLNIGRK